MIHESLKVNEFIVKEDQAFRMKVQSWEVVSPNGLFNVDFIQECLGKDGKVDFTNTYNFHLTKEEIGNLCKGLLTV